MSELSLAVDTYNRLYTKYSVLIKPCDNIALTFSYRKCFN